MGRLAWCGLDVAESVAWTIPLRTQTEGNSGGHWREKANRAVTQRLAVGLSFPYTWKGRGKTERINVQLTRIAPKPLDPFDNLPGSLKHVADEIAEQLGTHDGPGSNVVFLPAKQRSGKKREYAVEIQMEVVG